jgi:thiol-disulfide isomerase/thioredoxin
MLKLSRGLLIILSLLGSSCFAPSVKKGVRVPDIEGKSPAGEVVRLSSYEGNVVLIDFWATWCSPCRSGAPRLDELQRSYKDKRFVVLAVDTRDSTEKASAYAAKYMPALKVVTDSKGALAAAFGVHALPTNVLVDAKGIVRFTCAGYSKGKLAHLKVMIDNLLAQNGSQKPSG